MLRYANSTSIPLSLAVFLATDNYDHNDDPYTISVTTLIKPLRQVILAARVPASDAVIDLNQLLPSRMGTAIHDGIERAWKENYPKAMKALGYPDKVIERILINPHPDVLKGAEDWAIPIYLEERLTKKIGKWTVTGKFDFIGDGRLEDFKSTTVYTAIHSTNDDKHILQGSIYRWLDPVKITSPEMAIQFIFTDWSRVKALSDPKYPQQRLQTRIHVLKPLQETEAFVRTRLSQIETLWDTPEDSLPRCSDEDLWRSDPVFKYYKNPAKTARSTKNFDNQHDANMRRIDDGNVGIVVMKPGEVTACKYCSAFSVCGQKDQLIASGDLQL